VPLFVHVYEEQKVICNLCKQGFEYMEEEDNFTNNNLPMRFRNLKKSMRQHLKSMGHIAMVKSSRAATKEEEKAEARNRVIGATVGGLVYHLVYNGRPDSDLPLLIYRVKMPGGDTGDINHSTYLVSQLLPEIAEVVAGRLKRMLSSRMVATGNLPPVNIMADKATDKRCVVTNLWSLT
jgi:hypothetical protein